MVNESIKRRLLHLQNMAIRGTPGEQRNAKELLRLMYEKYGLPEAVINEPTQWVKYTYKNAMEKQLIFHISGRVLGEWGEYNQASSKAIELELTASQRVEFDRLYSLFLPLWRKELERLFEAFWRKHGLHAPFKSSKHDEGGVSFDDLPDEEKEEIRQMLAMYDLIAPVSLKPELGNGTTNDSE